MQRKKECVAMLLAGGQGSRLYALTNKIAKPAVAFGAKYRIIDFPLSNCINSGIDTVGVLTQYEPLELNEYIGNGQPWDLDRAYGGVHILSPYQAKVKSSWYEGTANAIYQNMHFMKKYNPDYVLILSGDHIYKMDYAKMLKAHIETGADCTIAAIEVPLKEASRFGILNTNPDGSIYQFEEKPKQPKSTLASMGIYIFTAQKLYDYLEADEENPDSSKDFGKDVLPAMMTLSLTSAPSSTTTLLASTECSTVPSISQPSAIMELPTCALSPMYSGGASGLREWIFQSGSATSKTGSSPRSSMFASHSEEMVPTSFQ